MMDFTVVLNESATFDIFLDGELSYFGLSPEDIKEFAESFADSNVTVE